MQEERESGFLFPNDFIIFDEAHTVEQVASKQIGIGVSQYGLRSTIQRLYNARTRKGLFTVMRDAAGVRLAAELIDDVDKFFSAVESKSNFRKGREFRVRDVELVPDTITARLTALQARVAEVVKRAEDEILKAELQDFGRRIRDARDGISIFLEQSAPEHVYWVERTGRTARFLALNAAPIDLAPVLRRMLFRDNCCCVMTSATLAVGRPDLAYFREAHRGDGSRAVAARQPVRFPEADEGVRRPKDARSARCRLSESARTLDRAFRGEERRPGVRAFYELSRHAAGLRLRWRNFSRPKI